MRDPNAALFHDRLQSNHIHLVVRAGKDPFERLMKSVHSGFAVWLNNQSKGRRDGAVFSQRYRSILVEEEPYLFELIRYIHNNPVRARVASAAADSGKAEALAAAQRAFIESGGRYAHPYFWGAFVLVGQMK